MSISGLGKLYEDGETIVAQGDVGNCMFVVQVGRVQVVRGDAGGEAQLTILQRGDTFGEMAILDHERRSATVRALGQARVLTIDRRTFLRRVREDPTLAFHTLHSMGARVRSLSAEVVELRRRLEQREAASAGAASPQRKEA
ncbi:MAG: cyclic nucleotide-binding domain-containing protein [Deltaproteobacteria bacterium]|nr:cyclic nucleotide-binding domain-containing protein [Deltaproteobacteria bacterium]